MNQASTLISLVLAIWGSSASFAQEDYTVQKRNILQPESQDWWYEEFPFEYGGHPVFYLRGPIVLRKMKQPTIILQAATIEAVGFKKQPAYILIVDDPDGFRVLTSIDRNGFGLECTTSCEIMGTVLPCSIFKYTVNYFSWEEEGGIDELVEWQFRKNGEWTENKYDLTNGRVFVLGIDEASKEISLVQLNKKLLSADSWKKFQQSGGHDKVEIVHEWWQDSKANK